ncbi:hypothetical protein [Pseudomonas salomonii]|uniref:Uncharacterized protein n=1 Tax=Pseudomonas salomonii TaxID=191391 RepID=A0A1H3ILY7_9PSED|nr:hypothetical protein [Pseudomonas salomonii]SDY28617.1 hypothetical protein SAMN05216247_103298 [Pseudomonas salomonii]
MRLSLVRYLQWVFPVLLRAEDGYVIYDRYKYRSERDLIVVLYSNFLALPDSYYCERGFDKVWALVDSIADEDLLFHELGNEVAGIAWRQGFVGRLDRILIARENAADEYYWSLRSGSELALMKFALRYMGKFKDMIYGGSMKSLIQSFHDKKREEFIRRYRLVNPERAEILDECKTEGECDKFLKNDKGFMQVLRQRLMDVGKFESIDYLTGADLGK